MPITITLTAQSGAGVDLSADFDNYFDSFAPFGFPIWRPEDGDTTQMLHLDTPEAGSEAEAKVIVVEGEDFQYDTSTHTVSGTIQSVRLSYLGEAYDTETMDLTPTDGLVTADARFIEITGLDIVNPVGERGEVHEMVAGFMGGGPDGTTVDAAPLEAALWSQAHRLFGSTGGDTYGGSTYGDRAYGRSGADDLRGGKGQDTLFGQNGNDTLLGQNGHDTLVGGNGHDSLNGGNGNDSLTGGKGRDSLSGGKGKDALSGGNGNDSLTGGNGNDTLSGGNGNDTLSGGKGNDLLSGGLHRDRLDGQNGADTLNGGNGNDTLSGGNGTDSFVFSGRGFGRDLITDFTPGVDFLDLSDAAGEVRSFAAFARKVTEVDGNLVYDKGNDGKNVIVLNGISLDDLTRDDFLF